MPQNVLQIPELYLTVGDLDISNFATSLHIIVPWGGKASIQGTLVEFDSATHLVKPYPSNMLSGALNHFSYPALAVIPNPPPTNPTPTKPNAANIIACRLAVAGVSSNLPSFLTKSPKTDGLVTAFKGVDFAALLGLENQTMPTITTSQNAATAQSTINFICATYGINKVIYNWPDYPIHELKRANGIPLNWVDLLGKPYCASRSFRGQTMYSLSLGGNCTTTPVTSTVGLLKPPLQQNWVLTDYKVLEKLDLEYSDPPKNQFTVSRTRNNNILAEATCSGGQCVGRTVKASFGNGATSIHPQVKSALQGSIIDFVYFLKDGTPLNASAPSAGPVTSPIPIVSVEATYIPAYTQAGQSTTVGAPGGYLVGGLGDYGYDVVFTGGSDVSASDTIYSVVANNTIAQSEYGLNTEYTALTDPTIPTSLVCADYANCVCYDSVRKSFWCRVTTPYINPAMRPGDIVVLTDYSTNQSSLGWFVEQVDFIMQERDVWSMELILTKGPLLSSQP